ncbi:MAG: sugar ABC transporter substrate-binding protein [Firmicutes bacterium]|nr:sugar ABC transporter substrate-binding protein [Bacillota bacterium]
MFTICLFGVVMSFAALVSAEEVVTIQYAFWGNPAAIGVEKDIIEEFERTHPTIKVNPIVAPYPEYHSKLLTLIAGKQAPDVMRVDSYYFADFAKAKALMDITSLIKRDNLPMEKYYPAGLLDVKKGNRYYGLPWSTAPLYVAINLKMFKEAGIPIPSIDWKYDEFLKIMRQLSKREGAYRQYGYALYAGSISYILPFVWGNGGDLFDKSRRKFTLNNPPAVQRIQEVADLIKEGVIADPANFPSNDVVVRWIANNQVAMAMVTMIEILSLQQIQGVEFEVLPFPGTAKYPNVTIYKSNVVGLSATIKDKKKKEAAWTFLKFLRAPGERGEVLYMKAKRMPPTCDDPELWKIFTDLSKPPRMIVEVTNAIANKYAHLLPLRSGWLEVEGVLLPQLQRIYSGQVSAQQGLNEIAPKIQEILDRTN